MRICIVRTGGRLSARADACTIEPRLDVAAFPESPTGALSLALGFVISTLRVLGPIQRKTVAHKPFRKIRATDRTGRNRAAIPVEAERDTVDRTPRNESVEVIGRLRTATILQTVLTATLLSAFRSIHTPKADPRSPNFQR